MSHPHCSSHSIHRRQLLAGASAALATLGLPAARAAAQSEAVPGKSAATGEGDGGKTLLILGGTGFLGPHVVEAALARGWTVTLFNRGQTNAHLFPELEKLVGDRNPTRGDGLTALAGERTWDYVVDTTSYVPARTADAIELLRDRIERYALISTISVYADFATDNQDETAPVGRLDDPESAQLSNETYGPLKALCEEKAEELMPGRVANIRPGLIVGPLDPTDRFTYWPVRVREGGEVIAPGELDDPVQYIDVRDLAAFTLDCLERDHMGVYNATGPVYGETIAGLVYGCRAATTSDARLRWVDADTLERLELYPWMHLPVWMPAGGESTGMGTIDIRKAAAAGLVSRPLADTVRDTLAWWDEQPADRQLRRAMSREMEAAALAKIDAGEVPERTAAEPESAEPESAGSGSAEEDEG
ncbi:NAD-dependent epimerase/dehydratase family protein [Engelhardtia mirabilis]|uniref:NAD dependent epimerase/dehydratase family protein n=1 Tax=Engelhardtia mirabilis TaxID=2528011 RepID=A0A518BEU0_9BACT|nr:NAD dependent epimerase/dehydratase family protein [Planctomycetes bacterium Pla133]QDU99823.1 NAD dependent epimerase/dehydratase family protein [Planctomycetes bacterium Pla86]